VLTISNIVRGVGVTCDVDGIVAVAVVVGVIVCCVAVVGWCVIRVVLLQFDWCYCCCC